MSTLREILSAPDDEPNAMDIIRNNLHKIGLYETLCFTLTNDVEWWFIENNALIFSEWNDIGECELMIDWWGT